ncbi:M17 family metallopeptidase [Paenibacillus sp. ISL-20]|uniref:M17 family metallopeptidase n=1 Tax=Paenibacillus sp. ISL-20 TaxID=2819163 RepID=UPI002035D622|nr:M17 family metallopeptidase [Paenibacillus sp. ISL-20]
MQWTLQLIDVATLTGAVVSALGDIATGSVTKDGTFLQELITSSRRAGEKIWPLPSYPEFWYKLKRLL